MLWKLFKTFFVIGGFTFGGGQAMLMIIRHEIVVRNKWMSDEDFIDLFAIAQSLPGVFAVNISIFVGYKIKGFWGAILCGLACILPSFIVILVIAMFIAQFRGNPHVEAVFKGIRPAVIAMIAAPVVSIWKAMGLPLKMAWMPALAALAVWLLGISPVTVIIVSGIAGWVYGIYIKDKLPQPKAQELDQLNEPGKDENESLSD